MTTKELISKLKLMPPDANVRYIWDGAARSDVEYVYLSRGGEVMLVEDQAVYDIEERPVEASDVEFWYPSEVRSLFGSPPPTCMKLLCLIFGCCKCKKSREDMELIGYLKSSISGTQTQGIEIRALKDRLGKWYPAGSAIYIYYPPKR